MARVMKWIVLAGACTLLAMAVGCDAGPFGSCSDERPNPLLPDGLKIEGAGPVAVGTALQLHVKFTWDSGYKPNQNDEIMARMSLRWTVEPADGAAVSSAGVFRATKSGAYVVTVQGGGFSGATKVRATEADSSESTGESDEEDVTTETTGASETEFYVQPVKFQLAHPQLIHATFVNWNMFDAFVKNLLFVCDGQSLAMYPQTFGIDWDDAGDPFHGEFARSGDLELVRARPDSSGFKAPLSFTINVDGTRITSWGDRKTISTDEFRGTMYARAIVADGTVDVEFSGEFHHESSFERDNKTVITNVEQSQGTWVVRFNVEPLAGSD